jgi:small subunit ribosomal protein S11
MNKLKNNYTKYLESKEKELKSIAKVNISNDLKHVVIHAKCSFNNTIFTVTDLNGNSLMWSSPACHGLKGSRRSTTFAARVALIEIAKNLNELNVETASLRLKGIGPGRRQITKILSDYSIEVESIQDVTPLPFNGTKKRVKRRI